MRCYFSHHGHIIAIEKWADTGSDNDAIEHAEKRLEDRKEFSGYEIWDGERLVYRFMEEGPE